MVLDLGCGKEKRPSNVIGIDLLYGDVIADMEKLPFKDNSFNMAIANHSIEHVKNPQLVFKETLRVLKSEGLFIINTPNLASWHNRLFLMFGEEPPYAYDPRHHKCYTYHTLKKLFDGFKVLSHKTYGNERKGIFCLIEKFFTLLGMGSNINVLLQKEN